MTVYEQAIQKAKELESQNLFRRAADKWGKALSLSQDRKQEKECTKNNLRCVRKVQVTVRERW
ncbi:PerC family transcriptional regulator [Xenorhabdus thuongxuanensis]|uniref:PerC family transcriptional regulator n=1 Tax=Xenorhabdus thuongxuanensis TaxID=1873484 RepID=A0A1Q5TMU2_9GAMM|nr:PerC family transcriptional regulator [Xenorhabdus thuongxuanensis]OKP01539.1 hypothetical protein Xentx_03412 [Xenorhabdus thuongxuanensis]